MSRKSRESTHLELPAEVKEALKSEDDDMWRIVTDAVRTYLAVDTDSIAALRRQEERLEAEITEIKTRLQSLEDEHDELLAKKQRVRSQIEQLEEERCSYDEILDSIIETLADDPSLGIASQMSDIETAAEIQNGGVATEDAIDQVCQDIRSRVNERDIEIVPRQLHRDLLATGANVKSSDGPGLRALRGVDDGEA